ncbi:MAG: hypothetical protein U5K56_00040 [Halioglobus sp.]|nr:hypothetical protein [Halioglobus sp.]
MRDGVGLVQQAGLAGQAGIVDFNIDAGVQGRRQVGHQVAHAKGHIHPAHQRAAALGDRIEPGSVVVDGQIHDKGRRRTARLILRQRERFGDNDLAGVPGLLGGSARYWVAENIESQCLDIGFVEGVDIRDGRELLPVTRRVNPVGKRQFPADLFDMTRQLPGRHRHRKRDGLYALQCPGEIQGWDIGGKFLVIDTLGTVEETLDAARHNLVVVQLLGDGRLHPLTLVEKERFEGDAGLALRLFPVNPRGNGARGENQPEKEPRQPALAGMSGRRNIIHGLYSVIRLCLRISATGNPVNAPVPYMCSNSGISRRHEGLRGALTAPVVQGCSPGRGPWCITTTLHGLPVDHLATSPGAR